MRRLVVALASLVLAYMVASILIGLISALLGNPLNELEPSIDAFVRGTALAPVNYVLEVLSVIGFPLRHAGTSAALGLVIVVVTSGLAVRYYRDLGRRWLRNDRSAASEA
jgi:hypothetical protein